MPSSPCRCISLPLRQDQLMVCLELVSGGKQIDMRNPPQISQHRKHRGRLVEVVVACTHQSIPSTGRKRVRFLGIALNEPSAGGGDTLQPGDSYMAGLNGNSVEPVAGDSTARFEPSTSIPSITSPFSTGVSLSPSCFFFCLLAR